MSSASAGRFQDHYEVLGVEHKAGSDAIQVAYARLADKYNPRTGVMPDLEKYESILLAFEVLSDPELRLDFDKRKGIGEEDKPKFSGMPFFEAYQRDTHLRIALMRTNLALLIRAILSKQTQMLMMMKRMEMKMRHGSK